MSLFPVRKTKLDAVECPDTNIANKAMRLVNKCLLFFTQLSICVCADAQLLFSAKQGCIGYGVFNTGWKGWLPTKSDETCRKVTLLNVDLARKTVTHPVEI